MSRGGIYAAGHIPAATALPEPLSIGKEQCGNWPLSRVQLCVVPEEVKRQSWEGEHHIDSAQFGEAHRARNFPCRKSVKG